MYTIQTTNRFEKDFKRVHKSGQKDMQKIKALMRKLANGERLDPKHNDHPLIGNYKGRRDCHIEPDWLLIYKIDGDKIIFERTGSHAELFE
jgi:mRNA interferase YafQ